MSVIKSAAIALAVIGATAGVTSTTAMAQSGFRYNWSGLYFGAHLGGAWAESTAVDVLPPLGGYFTPNGNGFDFESSGVLGGGQIGLQHQVGNWVFGGELSGSWGDLQETIPSPYFPGSDRQTIKLSAIFTATARLGYAWDNWMAYVKAGYAGADVEFRAFDFVGNVNYQDGLWHHGYALGAGVEYALMTGVRLGLDYTFVDLAAETMKGVNTLGGFEHYKTDADIHSVTARLNFQLGRQERAIERYEPLK